MQTAKRLRVAICAGTFRREEPLGALLAATARLEFSKIPAPEIQIVIVDNDARARAESVCRTAQVPWPLKYVVEPRRGISYVRNRALAEAGPVDFVAFIDDDEVPSPGWLDELLSAQAHFSADVISGPVVPRYAPDVPDWVRDGKFFEPPLLRTGTLRNVCATNNVLVRSRVFSKVPAFDDAFALSGAEDSDFFLRVAEAGYKIVWCEDAVVFETITRRRANMPWILRREYQTGNGWVFCEAGRGNSVRVRVMRCAKAWAHVAIGLFGALLWTMNRPAAARSLRRAALGMGMIAALAGFKFLSYQGAAVEAPRSAKAG